MADPSPFRRSNQIWALPKACSDRFLRFKTTNFDELAVEYPPSSHLTRHPDWLLNVRPVSEENPSEHKCWSYRRRSTLTHCCCCPRQLLRNHFASSIVSFNHTHRDKPSNVSSPARRLFCLTASALEPDAACISLTHLLRLHMRGLTFTIPSV